MDLLNMENRDKFRFSGFSVYHHAPQALFSASDLLFFLNIFYAHSKNVAMSPEAGSPVVCKNGNPLIKFSFFMKWANLHGVSSGSVQVERENCVGVPKIVSRLTGTFLL